MNEHPEAAAWAATRGEKWRAQLVGMEAMLAPFDEPLIDAAHLDAPYRIAEIGCGGGGTTFDILRRASAGSVVHGFDISAVLVEVARGRKPSDESAIAFEIADMATAAPEKPYDRLISRFGIMFFDDPLAAFTNLLRWLAPGGRFAFAAWSRPAENPWMAVVRNVVAEKISLPPPDIEAPGPFRYADAEKLVALLQRAGYDEVEVRDWRGALPIGGGLPAAEAASFALAAFSSFGEMLAEAGDEVFEEARQALTTRLAPHLQGGLVRMEATVHIFTGVRPE